MDQQYKERTPNNIFEKIIFNIAKDTSSYRVLILPYIPSYFIPAHLLRYGLIFHIMAIVIFIFMLFYSFRKCMDLENKIVFEYKDSVSISKLLLKHIIFALSISLFLYTLIQIIILFAGFV